MVENIAANSSCSLSGLGSNNASAPGAPRIIIYTPSNNKRDVIRPTRAFKGEMNSKTHFFNSGCFEDIDVEYGTTNPDIVSLTSLC